MTLTLDPIQQTRLCAEPFGWLAVEPWLSMRRLRNQMVHEYVEEMNILPDALSSSHAFAPRFIATVDDRKDEIMRCRLCDKPDTP